ncbi:hypothetical protein DNTS_021651 [Danionella cerebrum]|uniref:Dickkopf N-terminal cysteine-rich domain-containing protein n=1 Tax=Danionella cerebrum TaxID=2873325 RepID=A0A553QTH3_9TELE|nr:hypothetical protein DNTS_021651 [Danionella translucida]
MLTPSVSSAVRQTVLWMHHLAVSMQFLIGMILCLAVVHGIVPDISRTEIDIIADLQRNAVEGRTAERDAMQIQEVEDGQLEDTQPGPETQMNLETTQSMPSQDNISANLSEIEILGGNQSISSTERINKTTDTGNSTKETNNITSVQSRDTENNLNHDCVIDEDCEKNKYCLYETTSSRCLPCKELDVTCAKNEECCDGQLCVWGQCANNITKGNAGTICQYQKDCKDEYCCAFHKALLLPVCIPKPIERERCVIAANHLMDLLSWDLEEEGPQVHCPCVGDLECQHLGRGALCLEPQSSSEEEFMDSLYSETDYIV